jgi:hypothetical protein
MNTEQKSSELKTAETATNRRTFLVRLIPAALALAVYTVALPSRPVQAQSGPGMIITFKSGTGALGGSVTVRNAASGKEVSKRLDANINEASGATVLQNACFEAGLKADLDGFFAVKIYGAGNAVRVSGAVISKVDF